MSEEPCPYPPWHWLAPEVYGLVEEIAGILYIQMLVSVHDRQGNVGRYLDGLPKDRPLVAVRVVSTVLRGMLERRGFTPGKIVVAGVGEVDVYVRGSDPRFAKRDGQSSPDPA